MKPPLDRPLTEEELEELVANAPKTPEERYQRATGILQGAEDEYSRWCALATSAKAALETERFGEAEELAKELLTLSDAHRDDLNYGNAIHDSNVVMGVLAILKGDTKLASEHLLAAGRSPGSPQMNSFGPNMTLAKWLLEENREDVVLEYLVLCRAFWSLHGNRLVEWSEQIASGSRPDFGANLLY